MARHLSRILIAVFVVAHMLGTVTVALSAEYQLPDRVAVMPVAFVPSDQRPPSATEKAVFLKHIQWTQKRFRELLANETFDITKPQVQIVKGRRPLDYYRNANEGGAPDIVSELLTHFKVSRFECPHVYCIMLMNARDGFPAGGGRPINGGLNNGAGMMYIASYELTHNKHFQCTLQHELGHSFGLCHVDAYGYDMNANDSVMSYNPAHHNQGFTPSPTPGSFIAEDRRALAFNDRMFSKLDFDAERDIPTGYNLSRRIIPLGPMTLPGHPDFYPRVTTDGGEELGSKVANVVQQEIQPSAGPGITYNPGTMWHSKPLPNGEATLEITFPFPVQLTGLAIHSQHSGIDHHVTAMHLETADTTPRTVVAKQGVKEVDELVAFPAQTASKWSLTLAASATKILVIRGLQFFDGEQEVFPHMVPYAGARQARVPAAKPQPESGKR